MHIILGTFIIAGSFLLAMNYISDDFSGFWNLYSAILLLGVPIGLVIFSYRFSVIGSGLRGLLRAITQNPSRERERADVRLQHRRFPDGSLALPAQTPLRVPPRVGGMPPRDCARKICYARKDWI